MCLLFCLSKILENIMASKLSWFLKSIKSCYKSINHLTIEFGKAFDRPKFFRCTTPLISHSQFKVPITTKIQNIFFWQTEFPMGLVYLLLIFELISIKQIRSCIAFQKLNIIYLPLMFTF